MRPTLHASILAISMATGVRVGRVTHAARQLQQAGVLPTAVGASKRRLRPNQFAALTIAAVLDAPLRSLAEATAVVLHLRNADRTFGSALAHAFEHRRHVTATVDLGGAFATVRRADGSEEVFGRQPSATAVRRHCEIPAAVLRELIRRADCTTTGTIN
ncbi:hypothetical protein [Devosia sp. A16]|uniref:hypothetical protein n=1 Tax=Devosia sp. A16 TaxID=1736675 RepID=UPI000AF422E7|nr:hypothetical protein [Devosia sp. A16]